MSVGSQATFVVEYPGDRFCRIEVELAGERSHVTLPQLWDKADGLHRRGREPEFAEADVPVVDQEAARRPPVTVVPLRTWTGR